MSAAQGPVLVTGSLGTIGRVVATSMGRSLQVRSADLPAVDVRDPGATDMAVRGCRSVVHLAHDASETWRSGTVSPANARMLLNVLESAARFEVGRVVVASSVHVDDFLTCPAGSRLRVPGGWRPTSPYGADKIVQEELARRAADRGLDVVCIRFGGVSPDDSVRTAGREPAVWLSHDDLRAAMTAVLSAPVRPRSYVCFYAVSANAGRIHDTSNPFGCVPHDDSAARLRTGPDAAATTDRAK